MAAPELPRISDYVSYYARRTPWRTALVQGSRKLSYRDFEEAVRRTARALLASGVGRGDRVAMLAPPHR